MRCSEVPDGQDQPCHPAGSSVPPRGQLAQQPRRGERLREETSGQTHIRQLSCDGARVQDTPAPSTANTGRAATVRLGYTRITSTPARLCRRGRAAHPPALPSLQGLTPQISPSKARGEDVLSSLSAAPQKPKSQQCSRHHEGSRVGSAVSLWWKSLCHNRTSFLGTPQFTLVC